MKLLNGSPMIKTDTASTPSSITKMHFSLVHVAEVNSSSNTAMSPGGFGISGGTPNTEGRCGTAAQ